MDNALASLSIDQQQLVRWRVMQFMTYKEIAQKLRVTEPTARRRCQASPRRISRSPRAIRSVVALQVRVLLFASAAQ